MVEIVKETKVLNGKTYKCKCAEYTFDFNVEDSQIVEGQIYCSASDLSLPDIAIDVVGNLNVEIYVLFPVSEVPYNCVDDFVFKLKHAQKAAEEMREFFDEIRARYVS